MVKYVPDKGDIVWIDFEPQKGREITKRRPALVLSPLHYNLKSNLAIFAPFSTHIKGYPFEVAVELDQKKGVILCDQIRSMDWNERKAVNIAKLDKRILNQVISKLKLLLVS